MTLSRNGHETAVLDVNEAAAYLAVSRQAVYTLIREGKLAHVRVGEAIRLRREDLDAFLENHRTTDWKPGGRGRPPKDCGA